MKIGKVHAKAMRDICETCNNDKANKNNNNYRAKNLITTTKTLADTNAQSRMANRNCIVTASTNLVFDLCALDVTA